MTKVRFMIMLLLVALAGSVMADARPGTPRRQFNGRIFYYEPITYYSPVWYAGNGVIATRQWPGVPLWPGGQFNKIYK